MSSGSHRALVVDNEAAIGRLTVAALSAHGFACDVANDAVEAKVKLSAAAFDVVIVDVKILNEFGRPLAIEVLEQYNRPHVIVYTDRIDEKVAQQLIGLGADGVLSKPFNYELLAKKALSLLHTQRRHAPGTDAAPTAPASGTNGSPTTAAVAQERISTAAFKEKLGEVAHVLPISATALDVYQMTKSLDWDLSQIAAAVQRDASLTTEVLRMANSSYFNPPGRPIVDLDEAVMRIGQKRVGELALSINALSSVTPGKLPWLDLELSWNRSMAAGIALELLIDEGGHEQIAEGLFVSAIMHPLGRIVLGMLFPQDYTAMIAESGQTGASLRELERRRFPASHTDVMAELLADWRLAPEVFIPLKFSLDDYASIARLLEPMRTKAELVKVAIFLSRLAVGRWESWDFVQFPPATVLERLRIRSVADVIRQTRSDVARLAEFHPGGKIPKKKHSPAVDPRPVAYCNFSESGADLVNEFLPALGLEPQAYDFSDLRLFEAPLVANCLGVDLPHFVAHRTNNVAIILADEKECDDFAHYGSAIGLPNSYRRVRENVLANIAQKSGEPASSAN